MLLNPSRPTPVRARLLGVAVALALIAGSPAALGQAAELPASVVGATVIGSGERGQIEQYVAGSTADLGGTDPAAIRRARQALLRPLSAPTVSAAFREAFGKAALDSLTAAAAGEAPEARMSALRIAAAIGTQDTTSLVLAALKSTDPGTRAFAVSELGGTLSQLAAGSAALSGEQALRVVNDVAGVLGSADSALLADVAVRTLGAGVRADASAYGPVRSGAIEKLCEAVGTRLRATRARDADAGEEMLAALRACGVVRIAVSDPIVSPTPAASRAALQLAGDCVGLVLARVRTQTAQTAEGGIDRELLRTAESLGEFARQAHARASNRPPAGAEVTGLAAALEGGQDREFRNRAAGLFGPESDLVRAFNFETARFIRRESED